MKPYYYPPSSKKKGDYTSVRPLKFLSSCYSSLPSCCSLNRHSFLRNHATNFNKLHRLQAASSSDLCLLLFYGGALPVAHFQFCVCLCEHVCEWEPAVWTSLGKGRRTVHVGRKTDSGGRSPFDLFKGKKSNMAGNRYQNPAWGTKVLIGGENSSRI